MSSRGRDAVSGAAETEKHVLTFETAALAFGRMVIYVTKEDIKR
jgi:hypothetical protein